MNNKLNPIFLSIDNLINEKSKFSNIFDLLNKNDSFLESKSNYEKRAKTRFLFEKLTGRKEGGFFEDSIGDYLKNKALEGGLQFGIFLAFASVVAILKPLLIIWILGFFYLFTKFIKFIYNFVKYYLQSLNLTNEQKVLYSSYTSSSKESLKYSTNFEEFEDLNSLMENANLLKNNLIKFENYNINIEFYNKSLITSGISAEKYLLNPLENVFIKDRELAKTNYNMFDFVHKITEFKESADYFSLINFSNETFGRQDYKNFLNLVNVINQLNSYFKEKFEVIEKEQPTYEIIFSENNLESKIQELKKEQIELKNTLVELDSFIKINKNNKLVLNKLSELQERINYSHFNLMLLTKTGANKESKNNFEFENLKEAKDNINEMNQKLVELAELQQEINTLLRKKVTDPLNFVKSGEILKTMNL